MKDVAIRVEGVSKRYRIGATERHGRSFREMLTEAALAPFRRLREKKGPSGAVPEVWALQDVSFEVEPGEVVGIIGRNGAGKSTLLKVLSRITRPTRGRAEIHGRVASLLEVGTGFHPELTGRENVSLNGAILGMSREEIRRKFDEIVAFAEVEKFIDTPVKRYSSGMQLRLAFAVAAHLQPEILIIDEVLAVGDAEFQKKCLGKMEDVAHEGRTVLFVSHQLAAVRSLCSRAIQIHHGTVYRDGEPRDVVSRYLADGSGELTGERVWANPRERPGNDQFRLAAIRVANAAGELAGAFPSSEAVIVEMEFDLEYEHSALCIGFDLINRDGVVVFRTSHNDRAPHDWPVLTLGRNRLRCVIPPCILNHGVHTVAPKIGLHAIAWVVDGEPEISFEVLLDHSDSPFWKMESPQKFCGAIAPCLHWQTTVGTMAATPIDPRSVQFSTARS